MNNYKHITLTGYKQGDAEFAGVENAGENRGTIMQGWKSREWNFWHQTSGLENAGVDISGEEKVWKASCEAIITADCID